MNTLQAKSDVFFQCMVINSVVKNIYCLHEMKNRKPGIFPGLDFCRFENSKIPGNPGFFPKPPEKPGKFRKPGICKTLKKR